MSIELWERPLNKDWSRCLSICLYCDFVLYVNDLLYTFQSCYIDTDYQLQDYQLQDYQLWVYQLQDYQLWVYQLQNYKLQDFQLQDYQLYKDIGIDLKHNQCHHSGTGKFPNECIIQFSFCKRTIDSLGYPYIYLDKFCSQYNFLSFLSDHPIKNVLCEK